MTYSKHNLPVADNLLNQQFKVSEPNKVWTSDITYIPTDEGGLYWQGELGGLTLDARVGASYNWFSGRRQFVVTDATTNTTTYSTQANASWNGYSLTGHFGAAYQVDLGSVWFVRPQVQVDYFRLDQSAYSEHNGSAGFNLAIDETTGDEGPPRPGWRPGRGATRKTGNPKRGHPAG